MKGKNGLSIDGELEEFNKMKENLYFFLLSQKYFCFKSLLVL
jgi:hypothetical protein